MQQSARDGKRISAGCPGPYGMLRGWMGFEELSVAFYDYPEMIHEMIEHMTELTLRQLRKLPADLPIDYAGWWEDMASKNGPFVSPAMFREFLQPQYHRIMTELRQHGCALGMVDCDGNPAHHRAQLAGRRGEHHVPAGSGGGRGPLRLAPGIRHGAAPARRHRQRTAGQRRQSHRRASWNASNRCSTRAATSRTSTTWYRRISPTITIASTWRKSEN